MKDCCEKMAKAAPLFIRVTLGLFFVMAGVKKVGNPEMFLEMVQGFGFFDAGSTFEGLFVAVLPWAEIIGGGALFLGLMTKWAAALCALMLLSFLIAMGFGHPKMPFSKDVILLGAALSVMFGGAGSPSVDGMMNKGK